MLHSECFLIRPGCERVSNRFLLPVTDQVYVASLEQVPETGRWRFMDVNPKYETKVRPVLSDVGAQMVNSFV